MISATPRRVVTGLDSAGKSCVLIDGPADQVIWSTAETPADNGGDADRGGQFTFAMPAGGSKFLVSEIPPSDAMFAMGMHTTDTIDYIVVLKGEIVLVLETGEVTLVPGDTVVDRGISHGWRNDGTQSAFMAIVMIDAAPVGAGATLK